MNTTYRLILFIAVALMAVALMAQDKPVIVVHTFTAAPDVPWPYDMAMMQTQTIAEIKSKIGKEYEVKAEAPPGSAHVYILDGEILGWHPGNRAERMLVGWGTGRENADIHFWLTDDTGKKVLDHKDTIKAEFWANAYAGSVGQLSHPFAGKLARRLSDAKLK